MKPPASHAPTFSSSSPASTRQAPGARSIQQASFQSPGPGAGRRISSLLWRSPLLWRTYLVTACLIGIALTLGGWIGALVALGLGAVLLYWNVRSLFAPLLAITRTAQALARGSYDQRLPGIEFDEAAISSLGQAINSIAGDIDARMRSVAAERDRLETVLSATLEGVVAVDREARITLINQAAERLLDIRRENVEGHPIAEVCPAHSLVELVEEAIAEGQLQKDTIRDSGRLLEVYATPLKERAGVVLVIHDVTEVRRLESVRRDFVANVSHELKTPLTSIRAYLETLIDGGLEDKDNNLKFLHKIEVHVNRLTTLIADLLSLSRIESGDAFSQRLRVPATEILHGSFQRLAPNAAAKDIALSFHPGEAPIFILGDAEALCQIFDNLIDNAIKYTEPGGRVEVSIGREGSQVRVDVKDTGVGIPREDLPRIFERFYRVDKARSREMGGTGLGLSIVKHLVQALQGEILVESQVDVGSRFTVLLEAA